ncbi:MAG TPA: glycosyltransferase [Acetobacteraceae bacterium]|jgi:hypothetical protein|nr:glycosyltransferase [Acetobacteraceae bacterium]
MTFHQNAPITQPEATLSVRTSISPQGASQKPQGSPAPASRIPNPVEHHTVAILLSAHNGERFLHDQLASLVRQTHQRWVLYWRDDGSSDAAQAILQSFAAFAGKHRSHSVSGGGALGPTRSYLTLLASAWHDQFRYFAFADQDDVWFEDKITRGLRALSEVPPDVPALYCARQELVDEQLRYLGKSPRHAGKVGFPAALTQNIATGCTIIMNRAAAEVVLSLAPPEGTLHDWWCYIAVSAAGGEILVDNAAVLHYRQHLGNLVGSPVGILRRGIAALRRGPRPFMTILRNHVAVLQTHPDLLSDRARADLAVIAAGLDGGGRDKLRALGLRGFHRQTRLEDVVFGIWFLLG